MAIKTKRLAEFADNKGNQCAFEYDYDDVLLRVTQFRCINNTGNDAFGSVARSSNLNVKYEATFAPQSRFDVAVSNGAAQRLQLTVHPSGKLDGIEVSFRFPALRSAARG